MSKTLKGTSWRHGVRNGFERNGDVSCEQCFQQKLVIDRLREENSKLKEQLKRQRSRENGGATGVHTPSSQIPFKGKSESSKSENRGGARVGHAGSGRKSFSKESADEVVEIPVPECCQWCEGKVYHHSERHRSILDAAQMRVQKVVYSIERGKCSKCQKIQESPLPVFKGSLFGNALLAQVAVLHYLQGIPIGRICDLLGPSVNPGSIFTAMHRIAKRWEPTLEILTKEYRQSPVMHADETGWRTDGEPGWSWLFCSPDVSIFECHPSRSSIVPKRILGSDPLEGVLIVDRYNAYNKSPCRIQYCFAHLLREVKKLEDEFSDKKEVVDFSINLSHLLSQAMRLGTRNLTDAEYYLEAKKIADEIQAAASEPANHSGIESIQRIFLKNEERLYHWVTDRRIPSHNNVAEREIRRTVIARKVSFGSQSTNGAKTRSIFMSVLATAKKRLKDKSVEDWLISSLDSLAKNPGLDAHLLLPPQNS